jgi:glycosyltransferase involved in cell wall biosynthesis
MGIKQFAYNASVYGIFRPVAKPVHSGLISLALQGEKLLGTFASVKQDQDFINEKVTAVIKTFERPKVLKRLVKSLRKMYPEMKVIVVDDSREPLKLEGVESIVMPYDSGVSAGRAEALKKVETPYMLLLDDDFIFHRHTQIAPVLKKLEGLDHVDIIGGDVIYLPFYRKIDYTQAGLHPSDAVSVVEPNTEIEGMTVHDKVANFYIARTESIRKVGWDPAIKRLDHADFFTRAKGVLTTVFDPSFKVLHARTPFDKAYMQKRLDLEEDRKILWQKYYMHEAMRQKKAQKKL